MTGAWFVGLTPEKMKEKEFNPFTAGEALREPIFYGGESAYGFQYRDFSVQKYVADDQWIRDNKGFSIKSARDVVKAICDLQGTKLPLVHEALINLPPDQWTLLPGFEFSAKELSRYSGIDEQTVELVVQAFALPGRERNAGFRSLGDFNAASAFPLLRAGPNSFLLLQQYSLLEAIYEELDGCIDCILLLAEVEDITIGFGVVQHTVGARECLNEAVIFEVFIDNSVFKRGLSKPVKNIFTTNKISISPLRTRLAISW